MSVKSRINEDIYVNASLFMDDYLQDNPYAYDEIENLYMSDDEIADYFGVDEQYEIDNIRDRGEDVNEIFEWWIVDPFLYRQLKNHGEPVLHIEEYDWYLWGRTTTGQRIIDDYVIKRIFS